MLPHRQDAARKDGARTRALVKVIVDWTPVGGGSKEGRGRSRRIGEGRRTDAGFEKSERANQAGSEEGCIGSSSVSGQKINQSRAGVVRDALALDGWG